MNNMSNNQMNIKNMHGEWAYQPASQNTDTTPSPCNHTNVYNTEAQPTTDSTPVPSCHQNGLSTTGYSHAASQDMNNTVPQQGGNANIQTISLRPEVMTNVDFLPAYLSQHIGKWIRADFLIGQSIEQRVGILSDVGASYLIIKAIEPETFIVCDIFSLKFVTIISSNDYPKLLLV